MANLARSRSRAHLYARAAYRLNRADELSTMHVCTVASSQSHAIAIACATLLSVAVRGVQEGVRTHRCARVLSQNEHAAPLIWHTRPLKCRQTHAIREVHTPQI